jgi:mannose-6-phosphate isomerase-like protein (cupin superfamily)
MSVESGTTTKMVKKSSNQPDETRNFDKGKMEVTNIGTYSIGRATFEPGWKWSTSVKPIVKTDSCQVSHTMYVISGKMHVKMDDGTEAEFGPGDTGIVPPGHDAWVLGNEPCVAIDFTGAKTYAAQKK